MFADRRYEDDGQLVSRKESDALITDTEEAIEQVVKMVKSQKSLRKITRKLIFKQIQFVFMEMVNTH